MMSKLFEELELKFSRLDAKIAEKKVFVENLCTEQQDFLKEHFNVDTIKKKYSDEFNNRRHRLLEEIQTNVKLGMDHVNELVRTNEENARVNVYLNKLMKTRLIFDRSLIRSEMECLRFLILNFYKFESNFTATQFIKYKHVIDTIEIEKKYILLKLGKNEFLCLCYDKKF